MSDCGCEDYPCCGCGDAAAFIVCDDAWLDACDAMSDDPWPTSIEAKSWLFDNPYREFEPEVDDE